MRLEQANSQGGEAGGLAGWISTNDVTLFTMVLVVLISLFLNSNLIKRRKENERLDTANKELSANLQVTSAELEETERDRQSLDDLLKSTSGQLTLTQRQRDELRQNLERRLSQLEDLNRRLSALETEKASLESTRATLESDKEKLTTDLAQTRTSLTDTKQSMQQQKLTLEERIAQLTTNLEQLVKTKEDLERAKQSLEAERDRLQKQSNELETIAATLQAQIKASAEEKAALEKTVEDTKVVALAKIRELEQKAGDETKRADDYLDRLRRAADLFKNLRAEKVTLEEQLSSAELRFRQQTARETVVNRELVGLRGNLRRVAIVFDASGSMKEKGATGGDRWADAQRFASTWLQHLDVDECVLIVFSSDVRTFPANGTMVNIGGETGAEKRAELMAQLQAVEPAGWTNTLDALRKAYTYQDLDTIILFSDGAPTNANSGRFDPQVAEQIYALCRQHPNIPINTIGLGNYFDQNLATFLRTVAEITNGTFRGH